MSTIAPQLAFDHRPLRLRMRPDLIVQRQRFQGRVFWVIKDPVALRYYRLREEEYEILRLLDGEASPDEIRTQFEQRFAPKRMDWRRLQSFLGQLHRQGLILADAGGQAQELLALEKAHRRQHLAAAITNVLAIRLRGIDPERWLRRVYPALRWLCSRAWLSGCAVLVASALLLVTVQFDELWHKLPGIEQYFSLANAAWLTAAIMVSKTLHELGHALTCKHFGGECHEIGILLLAGIPCLYCDVSDSWMIPNKWHRAAVGAAGMVVEIVLAAVCIILWWFSQPGLVNSLTLALFLSCSVSTLLLNGNPLLRYDGYYILSDLLEMPNLGQRSRTALQRVLLNGGLGIPVPADREQRPVTQWLLAAYAVLSIAYGWMVLLTILWLITRILHAHRLELIGEVLTLFVLSGVLLPSVWQLVRFFQMPGRARQIRRPRAALALSCLLLLIAGAAWIPLPHRITAALVLEPRDAQRIYVIVPGILDSIDVLPGDQVAFGQALAKLTNRDVALDVARLTGERDLQQTRLQNLHRQRVGDPAVAAQIPAAAKTLEQIEEQLRQRQNDRNRLTLTANATGTVLPTLSVEADAELTAGVADDEPSPFEPAGIGRLLKTGTQFCMIGDPRRLEALLSIDQSDIDLVRVGQTVAMQFVELPGETFRGEIQEIAEIDSRSGRQGETAESPRRPEESKRQTVEMLYTARVSLDPGEHRLLLGYHGRAKVTVSPEPLLFRLLRAFRQTFHFRLWGDDAPSAGR